MLRFGLYKTKARGQTKCLQCNKNHNNAKIPVNCSCGAFMGGSKNEPEKGISGPIITNAKVIDQDIVSVRLNNKGGTNRIFVNLTENKVL